MSHSLGLIHQAKPYVGSKAIFHTAREVAGLPHNNCSLKIGMMVKAREGSVLGANGSTAGLQYALLLLAFAVIECHYLLQMFILNRCIERCCKQFQTILPFYILPFS